MRTTLLASAALAASASCRPQLQTYVTPQPVDTESRPVRLLPDTAFRTASGVVAEADFPMARLAGFAEADTLTADSLPLYLADVPAENEPINQSPWYAMRLAAPTERRVTVRLRFPAGTGNRYLPKTAPTRSGPWAYVPRADFDTSANALDVRLTLDAAGLYLAGQELIGTDSVRRFVGAFAKTHPGLRWDTIGTSRLGRPIWKLDTGTDDEDDRRPTVVLFTRQHPPEVTGFQAFQAFLARVFADDDLARGFRQTHRIIVFPTVNPDGVDEGHWRHNAGGIDLNRDWAYYRQPEVRTVVEWLQRHTTREQVVWGMDFHSTQYDVLYTHDPAKVEFRGAELVDAWTGALRAWVAERYGPPYAPARTRADYRAAVVGQDTLRIEPEGIGRPTSASWIAMHYRAVGVTYEVADEQDRAFIREKATRAAELWMEILRGRKS